MKLIATLIKKILEILYRLLGMDIFSFLVLWFLAFMYGFLRGLHFHPKLEADIAGYISNLIGFEFPVKRVNDLFVFIGLFILIMWFIFTQYSFSEIINLFKQKKPVYTFIPTLNKKKSKKSRRKKK